MREVDEEGASKSEVGKAAGKLGAGSRKLSAANSQLGSLRERGSRGASGQPRQSAAAQP